jgi:hypothetical protein
MQVPGAGAIRLLLHRQGRLRRNLMQRLEVCLIRAVRLSAAPCLRS